MKWSRTFVFAAVIIASTLTATAQEQIRLQFEVTRGSLVAKPELRVASGSEGLIVVGTDPARNSGLAGTRERIVVVPAIRGDDVDIKFAITSGERQFRPGLVISDAIRGSLEWTSSDGQPVRLTVTWIR